MWKCPRCGVGGKHEHRHRSERQDKNWNNAREDKNDYGDCAKTAILLPEIKKEPENEQGKEDKALHS